MPVLHVAVAGKSGPDWFPCIHTPYCQYFGTFQNSQGPYYDDATALR